MSCFRQLAIVSISNSVQELSLHFKECAKCPMKFSSVGHLVNEPKRNNNKFVFYCIQQG